VSNAVNGLLRRKHQIEVVTAFPHYPHGVIPRKYRGRAFVRQTWRGMRVFRVWMPAIPHVGFVRRLLVYLTFAASSLIGLPFVGKADVIWAANPNVFSSLPAMIYGLAKRLPVVRNVDDLWPEAAIEEGVARGHLSTLLGGLLASFSYRMCKAITPISHAYCRDIVAKYGIPAEKIHIVEVGVNTNVFRPTEPAASNMSHSRGRSFSVMYSGILGTGYDFETILKAAELLSADDSVQFVIRGAGELAEDIGRKIAKRRLQNVTLSTAYLQQDDLVDLLNSADTLILPMMAMKAHEAGIPTKLLEYMACGKPVICCSDGEPADLVKLARCGIVVPPGNPREVVKGVLTLKKRRQLRCELGRNGRTFVLKHLSIEQIGEKLERAFQSAAKR